MLRVLGRRNGTAEESAVLHVDTLGDPILARKALIDEAAEKLGGVVLLCQYLRVSISGPTSASPW